MDSTRNAEGPSHIPAGLTVTGELSSDHDLIIDGVFDGQITLPEQHLTVSARGRVKGRIVARAATISGTVDGSVTASERVTIAETAVIRAHLQTPSIAMKEGARFDGTVHPSGSEAAVHVAKYRQTHSEHAPVTPLKA